MYVPVIKSNNPIKTDHNMVKGSKRDPSKPDKRPGFKHSWYSHIMVFMELINNKNISINLILWLH